MTTHFPLGIAAGMVKSAAHVDEVLPDLVDTIVFGSFTLEPREGNKEPVFYYDDRTNGSINAIGLKNDGLQHFLDVELPKLGIMMQGRQCKIVVSLAPLKSGDLTKMIDMIIQCQHTHLIHRVEINAACPNHRDGDNLHPVLAHDPVAVEHLLQETGGIASTPRALKIAPEMKPRTLKRVVDLCVSYRIRYIVSGNTRLDSSVVEGKQRLSSPTGGHAGAPLLDAAVAQVALLRKIINKNVAEHQRPLLVGCGGTMTPVGMVKHKRAGADEIQVATLYYQFGVDAVQDLVLQYYTDE